MKNLFIQTCCGQRRGSTAVWWLRVYSDVDGPQETGFTHVQTRGIYIQKVFCFVCYCMGSFCRKWTPDCLIVGHWRYFGRNNLRWWWLSPSSVGHRGREQSLDAAGVMIPSSVAQKNKNPVLTRLKSGKERTKRENGN